MFAYRLDGLDQLQVSMTQLQQMDEETLWSIIQPAAELLKTRMQEMISRLFKRRTGSLYDSIEVRRKTGKDGGVYALVGPNDKPHPKSSTGARKARAQGGRGGHFRGTNAEVGYILEHGSARIPARHWMENACAESEEEVRQLLEQGWSAAVDAAGL